jgi:UDP-N-acetylmuramoyl-L-alanyl-D-glutamate--2,6-diaminopimelate ligase
MTQLSMPWKLNELLEPFGLGGSDVCISQLSQDSREDQSGALFVARSGANFSAIDFAEQAVSRGAKAVLLQGSRVEASCLAEQLDVEVIAWQPDTCSLAQLADRFYHSPSQSMTLVGITGTNGKTSSAHFLVQLLTHLGGRAAMLGTIGVGFLDDLRVSSHTTLDPIVLQRTLAELLESGADTVVMEVSSHAIDQGRIDQLAFDLVAYTNLSRDHLDYHGTMEAYAAAKSKLFDSYGVPLQLINADDAYAAQLLNETTEATRLSFSTQSSRANIAASNPEFSAQGLLFTLTMNEQTITVNTALMGSFNLSNLTLVLGAAAMLGNDLKDIENYVSKLQSVPGRMEVVSSAGDPCVIVDYAHTPDALEKALIACREHLVGGELLTLFGCGGDRDRGKRPMMAAIAEQLSDRVWVTSDNPRTENPQTIIDEIMLGFTGRKPTVEVIGRADAIDQIIDHATADDIVLIAGKGHEEYQEINGERLSFSDQKQALSALRRGATL